MQLFPAAYVGAGEKKQSIKVKAVLPKEWNEGFSNNELPCLFFVCGSTFRDI